MAVISPGKIWKNRRVPFEAESSEIEGWLLEINKILSFTLLVKKTPEDQDYLKAIKSPHGMSESIGYTQKNAAHTISGASKFVLQHELMHALGFHHEQLHSKGPWGLFGLKAGSKDKLDKELLHHWGINMVPEASRISEAAAAATASAAPKARARSSSFSAGEVLKVAVNQQAIDAHKDSYQAALDDKNIYHMGECDFDSVMMYSEMVNAAKTLKLKMVQTGKTADAPFLSNGDKQALEYLYNSTNVLGPAASH